MKTFEEIYESIDRDKVKLQRFQTMCLIIMAITVVLDIIVFFILKEKIGLMKTIPITIYILVIVYISIIGIKYIGKYNKIYKEKIIKNIIQGIGENIEYIPNARIPEIIYRDANFENFEKYKSSDLIKGKVLMAQVTTTKNEVDFEGNTTIKTIFSGLFGYYKMKQRFSGFLKIQKNVKTFFPKMDVTKLEMDSSEFEKGFDVYTDNKVLTMQLLTSEIMEKLTEIKQIIEEDYEILIQEDRIYIRVHTTKLFGLHELDALKYESLKRCYQIVKIFQQLPITIEKILAENT